MARPPRWPVAGVMVTALLLASTSPAMAGEGPDPIPMPENVRGRAADTLEFRLDLPASTPRGAPITVTLTLTNVSGRRLDLYLRGRDIVFDLTITREDGTPVWRRLEGEVTPAILKVESLDPGAALELKHTWDQRGDDGHAVDAGRYLVRGTLLTEGTPLLTPDARLEIREPPQPGPSASTDGPRG